MNQSHSFTLQELYHYYQISKSKYKSLSWNQAADSFCLEKDVLKEDHGKVCMAFNNMNSKIQRKKIQSKKLGKFTDHDGDKVALTILTNNSNADEYAIQASRDSS